ncbi:MAG: hypothetical protein HYZ53_15510 [Planctomycetes bacterium]|nr:hypothetical protein [Planctomycetota bacterium]
MRTRPRCLPDVAVGVALALGLALLAAGGARADDDKKGSKPPRREAPPSAEPPLPEAASASGGAAPAGDAVTVLVVHATPNCKAATDPDAACGSAMHWSPRLGNDYLSGKALTRALEAKADAARPDKKAATRLTVLIKPDRRATWKAMQEVLRSCEDAGIVKLEVLTTGGRLAIGHPHRASADLFQVAEVRVTVGPGEGGKGSLSLKAGPCKDDAEALRVIKANLNAQSQRSKYVPIYLEGDGGVTVGAMVHALDLCRRAGAEDFEFLAPPEKRK